MQTTKLESIPLDDLAIVTGGCKNRGGRQAAACCGGGGGGCGDSEVSVEVAAGGAQPQGVGGPAQPQGGQPPQFM